MSYDDKYQHSRTAARYHIPCCAQVDASPIRLLEFGGDGGLRHDIETSGGWARRDVQQGARSNAMTDHRCSVRSLMYNLGALS